MSATDGGPAFPAMKLTEAHGDLTSAKNSRFDPVGGMSLRDWFAGQALHAVLSGDDNGAFSSFVAKERIASNCYDLADVMLAERAKGEPK